MTHSDHLVKTILSKIDSRPIQKDMFGVEHRVWSKGKLLKDANVVIYDKKLNRYIYPTDVSAAEHRAAIALMREVLDNYGKDQSTCEVKLVKMMLIGLVHYIDKVRLLEYRDRNLYFYINDVKNQLWKYSWFDGKSKYTFPFDIDFNFYEDLSDKRRLVHDAKNVLIEIIVNTIARYKIVLVEGDSKLGADFTSLINKRKLADSLDGILDI